MIVPLGTDQIRLIKFTESETDGVHRFGGRAPLGIEPKDKTSRYLMTIGLEDNLCVSIFLKGDVFFFIDTAYTVFTAEDTCVEAFFHKPAQRREDDVHHSTYSGYGIFLQPLQEDVLELPVEEPWGGNSTPHPHNKVGGGTYLIDEEMRNIVKDLEAQGFHQFLQIDGSMMGDVEGENAFGYGILHFYLKPTQTHFDWCCFVELD